ncbi:MAG: hypothetical protein PHT60_15380 [Acidiphilium sp.]|nr:hypothetical protein [Acidiphilium sp.]MDD4937144.1 hypothetical protein [Acidiphilium sp.]
MGQPKIIQLIPAEGWTAEIGNIGSDKDKQPVAAFALLDSGDVVPMVPEHSEARLRPVIGHQGRLIRS